MPFQVNDMFFGMSFQRTPGRVHWIHIALFLALAPPCSELEGAQDTLVARASNLPAWGESINLVEELRIGTLLGSEESAFGNITGLCVSEDGVIWVADRTSNSIKRFDSLGAYLGEVGGHGRGPGEFGYLLGLAGLPGGQMAAWDMSWRRISIFLPDGEFSHSINLPEVEGGTVRPSFGVGREGQFFIRLSGRVPPAYIEVGSDGTILDTIPIPPRDPEGSAFGFKSYLFRQMHAYGTLTHSFLLPDGTFIRGRNDEYAFLRKLGDERVLRIERDWSPVPVKAAERRAFQAVEDHYSGRRNLKPGRVPKEKPPWWAFWVDEEERLWVACHGEGYHRPETPLERTQRAQFRIPSNEWWEPLVFDVIELNGRYLGAIKVPNLQTRLAAARGAQVWVIEAGEFDEKYIVRYRIEGG